MRDGRAHAIFDPILVLALLAGLVLAFALAISSGAIGAGFYEADESAHFVNAWFVADYLKHGLGASPIAYAMECYLHYPKISIGHWPPAYYGIVGTLFLVLPATPAVAMVIAVIVSVVPAAFVALSVRRISPSGWVTIAAVLWYVLTPVVGQGRYYFLADQALAAAVLAAAAAWSWLTLRPSPLRAILVAALFALAVLVKGNGFLLALYAPLHIALTGRWALLKSQWIWLAGILAAVPILGWQFLTAGIADSDFIYESGLPYVALSLSTNIATLAKNVGIVGLAAAVVGIWAGFRATGQRREIAMVCLACVIATLAFHALVPIALVTRYMAPIVPPIVVLAVLGFETLWALIARRTSPTVASAALAVAAIGAVVPALIAIANLPTKLTLRTAEVARAMAGGTSPAIWVVDGSAGQEGSLIAEVAAVDAPRHLYVARASQLLSQSSFMGNEYRLLASTPAAVLAKLDELGAAGVVTIERKGSPPLPHTRLLRNALSSPGAPYRLVASLELPGGHGATHIYRATKAVEPDLKRLRSVTIPHRTGNLGISGSDRS